MAQAANDNEAWLAVEELVRRGYVKPDDAQALYAILDSITGDRILVQSVSALL